MKNNDETSTVKPGIREWQLVIIGLVLVGMVVGTVGATDIPIWTNDTHQWTQGNVTAAWIIGDTMSVTWQDNLDLTAEDQVGAVTLYCPDNINYLMPVWGGMANLYSGQWDFLLSDIYRANVDGCHFAMVRGDWEVE